MVSDGLVSTGAVAFRLDLPHGRCVGVAINEGGPPAEQLAALDPQERTYLAGLPPGRQGSFAAGRLALRVALSELGIPLAPILPDGRGAPTLPAGAVGSISHKRRLAIALAARAPGLALGVDLEEDRPFRIDISRRVLTPPELAEVQALAEPARTSAVLDRFCLKEAFYKAANRLVPRTISFQEVAVVAIDPDGQASFAGSFLDAHPLLPAGWVGRPHPGHVMASVRIEPPV